MQIGPSLGLLQALGTMPVSPEPARAAPEVAAARGRVESERAIPPQRHELHSPAGRGPNEGVASAPPPAAGVVPGARGRLIDLLV